jgi:hypothetical protein
LRCRPPIVHPRTRDPHHDQQPQGVDQEMPCAPLHLLATIIAALSAAHLGCLHRLAIDTRRTGGGLPTCGPTGLFAQRRKHGGPRAIVAPMRTVVVHRALGQSIVWEHRPLTPAPIQRHERIDHFTHVHLTGASPMWGASCGNERFQNRPLVVRQIGGLRLSGRRFRGHGGALLSPCGVRQWSNKSCVLASSVSG